MRSIVCKYRICFRAQYSFEKKRKKTFLFFTFFHKIVFLIKNYILISFLFIFYFFRRKTKLELEIVSVFTPDTFWRCAERTGSAWYHRSLRFLRFDFSFCLVSSLLLSLWWHFSHVNRRICECCVKWPKKSDTDEENHRSGSWTWR